MQEGPLNWASGANGLSHAQTFFSWEGGGVDGNEMVVSNKTVPSKFLPGSSGVCTAVEPVEHIFGGRLQQQQ